MQSISQFIQTLKTVEAQMFNINTHLEPLTLDDGSIGLELQSLLDQPELIALLDLTLDCLNQLSDHLSPIALLVKTMVKRRPKSPITPYAQFIIDEPALKQPFKQLSFEDILEQLDEPIKPIKRRKPIEYDGVCLKCGAPNEYIGKHTDKQYKCFICKHTFTLKPTYHDEIVHRCPHCEHKLSLHHERKNFDVLVCQNQRCSFYLKNMKDVKFGHVDHLKTSSNGLKLRYTFRLFNFDLASIKANIPFTINSKIDLAKIHHSNHTLGLILTYYVNYGLSSRKTSRIMREIHDIAISHQTVVNYAEAVATIIESLNVIYPYELSNHIAFDETYIKVNGANNYVFFGSDTSNKIITSYRIFEKRDTKNAVTTLFQTLNKYKTLPEPLNVITDANPIYNAAQVFFKMNDIHFDLYQVVGVKNNDVVSKTWRSYKQVEERLNRTYKQNYYGTNGYGSLRNANVYMSLFVAFYNFLREHSALKFKTPIQLDFLNETRIMPFKWLKLIEYTHHLFKGANYVS